MSYLPITSISQQINLVDAKDYVHKFFAFPFL